MKKVTIMLSLFLCGQVLFGQNKARYTQSAPEIETIKTKTNLPLTVPIVCASALKK